MTIDRAYGSWPGDGDSYNYFAVDGGSITVSTKGLSQSGHRLGADTTRSTDDERLFEHVFLDANEWTNGGFNLTRQNPPVDGEPPFEGSGLVDTEQEADRRFREVHGQLPEHGLAVERAQALNIDEFTGAAYNHGNVRVSVSDMTPPGSTESTSFVAKSTESPAGEIIVDGKTIGSSHTTAVTVWSWDRGDDGIKVPKVQAIVTDRGPVTFTVGDAATLRDALRYPDGYYEGGSLIDSILNGFRLVGKVQGSDVAPFEETLRMLATA